MLRVSGAARQSSSAMMIFLFYKRPKAPIIPQRRVLVKSFFKFFQTFLGGRSVLVLDPSPPWYYITDLDACQGVRAK